MKSTGWKFKPDQKGSYMTNTIPRIGVGVIVHTPLGYPMLRRQGSHGAGTWCWPGGHLELGESVLACALRECAEETGIALTRAEILPWFTEDRFEDGLHYITLYVRGESGECARNLEPHKCDALLHVNQDIELIDEYTGGELFSGVAQSWRLFRQLEQK
jgi:8-oxo-dGTP diphosphatase